VAGPLLGGFFTDHLTWRWVFYVNLPLGILALFVTSAGAAASSRRRQVRIDWLGTALLAIGITCLVLLTTWGGTEYAWGSPVILGLGDRHRGRGHRLPLRGAAIRPSPPSRCACSGCARSTSPPPSASWSAWRCSAPSRTCRPSCRWPTGPRPATPACCWSRSWAGC
jgi:MFS family permease